MCVTRPVLLKGEHESIYVEKKLQISAMLWFMVTYDDHVLLWIT